MIAKSKYCKMGRRFIIKIVTNFCKTSLYHSCSLQYNDSGKVCHISQHVSYICLNEEMYCCHFVQKVSWELAKFKKILPGSIKALGFSYEIVVVVVVV